MKRNTILIAGFLPLIMLISAGTKDDQKTGSSLEGVWEMEHQFLYENDQIQDTLFNLNGYRQVKIYSKGKVMWSRYNPIDSNEWFGYGTYSLKNGMLEERLEYASNAMMKIVDTVQVFRFQIEFDQDHYSQVSFDAEGNRYNSENYKRIE